MCGKEREIFHLGTWAGWGLEEEAGCEAASSSVASAQESFVGDLGGMLGRADGGTCLGLAFSLG